MPQGLSRPFVLTPRTGDTLRAVDALADSTNLVSALTGSYVMETSLGRNLEKLLQRAPLRRAVQAEHGLLAIDALPSVTGLTLSVPVTTVFMAGEAFTLRGAQPDGSQLLNFATLQVGSYAVIVETWRSLVGPTSFAQATEPAQFLGASDTANKPTATTLYFGGNIDNPVGPGDLPLVTQTVITQKFEQRQYRLRVVQDQDLSVYLSDLIPQVPLYPEYPSGAQVPGASYAPLGDNLFLASLPQLPVSYARAFDRQIHAFKLCRVIIGPSGLQVLARTLTSTAEPCAQVLPSRRQLAIGTAQVLTDLLRRVTDLEASRGAYTLQTVQAFGVADRDTSGTGLPQKVPFPAGSGNIDLSRDVASYPSRAVPNFSGPLRISAGGTFDVSSGVGVRGLRLLVNGQPSGFSISVPAVVTELTELSLSASLNVVAGQFIELEAFQSSGQTLRLLRCTLAFSR